MHCPVKKLNPFNFQFITIVSVWSSVALTLVANVFGLCVRAGFGAQNCQPALNLRRSRKLQFCTSPRLTQNPCYAVALLFFHFIAALNTILNKLAHEIQPILCCNCFNSSSLFVMSPNTSFNGFKLL